MPKFLNHLDLNANQLKNAKLEITDSPTQAKGIIHYHDSTNKVRVYTGTGNSDYFVLEPGGGDITGVDLTGTAGAISIDNETNTTGGAYSSTLSLVAANTVLTSILNTGFTKIGTATNEEYITFGTSNEVNTFIGNTERLSVTATGVDITGALTVSGSYNLASGDIPNNAADTSGNAATATKIASIANSDIVQLSATQTLTNKTIAASQVTEISNLTEDEGAQLENIGSTTISATQWGYLGGATGAITNTDVDVSVGNLEARLPQIDSATTIGNGVAITAGGDFIVTGDLTVSGNTTTVNTATLTVEDPLIRLAKGNTSNDAVDIGIFGVYDTSGSTDLFAGLFRDASDSGKWKLFKDSQTDPGTGTTINTGASGYAVATLVANIEGDVTGDLTGNVTGNVSGSAATVTTAAQTNITSLGTLTALTVDDVAIDGKVITMTGSTSDTATFTAGTNGTLDIVTTDGGGAAANIQITADGTAELAGTTLTLDSSGGITLDADGGTITFADGGSSLGTITSSGYSGNAGTASALASAVNIAGESFDGSASISLNNNAITNGANYITASSNITGTSAGLTAGSVGAVKVFELTHGVGGVANENSSNSTNSAEWTITHGMGNGRFYKVEVVLDSGNYDTVYVDVTRPSDATVKVVFGSDVANGAYRAMLTRMA